MTAQLSHQLINEAPDLDLTGLLLYGVVQSTADQGPSDMHVEEPECSLEKTVYVANCRQGFLATYRINPSRHLELVNYQLPQIDGQELPDVVEANPTIWGSFRAALGFPEKIRMVPTRQPVGFHFTGNFWLLMKTDFFAPQRTYIPAFDGVLTSDKRSWLIR